jgi:hypothetical protein
MVGEMRGAAVDGISGPPAPAIRTAKWKHG